jgi:hypothetical protein
MTLSRIQSNKSAFEVTNEGVSGRLQFAIPVFSDSISFFMPIIQFETKLRSKWLQQKKFPSHQSVRLTSLLKSTYLPMVAMTLPSR